MSHSISRRTALSTALLGLAPVAGADEPKGTFGFAAAVDVDGVFSPSLKSASVASVQAGLPAALAGVVAGDEIVEVEGEKVAGAKASAMADRMRKRPGEKVTLKLRRAAGDVVVVTLVAVARR